MKNKEMKKLIKPVLFLVTVIFCFSVCVLSSSFESNAITYVGVCGENVKWYLDGRTGNIKIEGKGAIENFEKYDDAPWYEYRDIIETVEIENGITNLSNYMFYRAENLTSVEIAKSVTEIGAYAFYGCADLRTLDFQKNSSLTVIGENAFAYCRNLAHFDMPTRVTEIRKNAFLYCYKLSELTLGYSVKTIGEDAFSCCSFLEKIRIINYECDIFDDGETIYNKTLIESFDVSTANTFADKYLREFSAIKDVKFLNDKKIDLSYDEYNYDGKTKKPKVIIKGLTEGKDFTVDYLNNVEPGVATVTVSAAGDTLGEVTKNFKINPARAENLRVETRKEETLKLTWDEVHGASGYIVYQLVGDEWIKLGTTEKLTFTVKDLESSNIYKFKVRAFTKSGDTKCYGKFSEWLTTATKPETPVINSVSNRGIGRLSFSWSSVADCDGYEIYISTKKSKKYELAGETTGRYRCSYTLRNLESNQKYYIKVKAYKLVDGLRVYSSESEVISKSAM